MANNNMFLGNNSLNNFQTNTGFIAKATPTTSLISDAAKKGINDYVDSLGLQGMDKQLKIQELTQKTLEAKKQNEYNQGRTDVKTDLSWKALNAANKEEADGYKTQGKLADLADMIRGYIQKAEGRTIQGRDEEIVSTFLKENQDMVAPFASYISGDQSAYEFAKLYGFDATQEQISKDKRTSSWRSSLTSDEGEWNDDILGHWDYESYDDVEGSKTWGFVKNAGKSLYNLGSDVVNLVANPIDTANALAKTAVGGLMNLTTLDDYLDPDGEGWLNSANQVADGLGDILKERYGSWEGIKNTAYTDPFGMVSDIASIIEGGAGLVKGVSKGAALGATKAGMRGAGTLEKVADTAGDVARIAHKSDPFVWMAEGGAKGISYAGKKAINSNMANKVKDAAVNLEDSIVGLDKETKKAIQSNPYAGSTWKEVENYIDENGLPTKSQEVSKSLIADLSEAVQKDLKKYVEQFNETGPLYKTLKNGDYKIDLSGVKENINKFLEEQGVKIGEDGSLNFTDTAVTPTEASAIRRAYQWLTPEESQPVAQYLRHRKGIDQLGLWEDAKGTPGKDILKGMRELANEEAHNQIKPLKELDKLYSEQIDLLNKATEGLVYRDKRRFGEYRDNFNQILKNMDTPNRKRMKDRLEKIIPGLEQKVEAINLMPKLIDNYYRPGKADKWLSYAGGLAGSAIGGGLPGLALGAGVGYGLSKIYDKVKSDRWNKVISNLSDEGKNKMAEIEEAVKEKKKLSKDQEKFLEQIRKELEEDVGLDQSQASSKTAKYQVADDLESQYETAVKNGDEAKAKEILKEYAESKGYKGTEDYKGRGAWSAPSADVDKADFRNLEKIGEVLEDGGDSNLYAVANGYSAMPVDMLERENTWRYFRTNTEREAYYPIREAMDEIQRQMKEYGEVKDMPKVTVYRAVPDYSKSIKKLQADIDKFTIGEDGKPHIRGSLSQLSKDALESYDYYADMYKKYGGKNPVENLYERLTSDRDYKDSLSVKEGMLESGGEWVTPSKEYAREHGRNRFDGEYKIIKDDIPADQLWWDGNAIEERGFDDGNNYVVKKGAKNSRKNLEIEYDDKGNLIPLSKRFNEKKSDPRYQKYGTAGKNEKGMTATEGLNIRNFKNGKTVQELADNYGINTKIVDSISTPEGQKAYGVYGDKVITLAKDLKESTVPHELLHATFDMVDSTKRKSILEGIQKKLNVDEIQAEEWLADNFSEYYRTGKFDVKGIPTTFAGKVKQFFQQIKEYIDGTYANRKEIQNLFNDIIDGKLEGEYGAYSDPKFQSVWHGSPADFERFDSTHMGEGEGAQAHGWGHYVAAEERTGRHYAGLKGGAIEYKGENLRGIKDKTREQDIASNIGNRMEAGYSFEDAKNNLISFYKERAEHYKKQDIDGSHPFYRNYANKREEDLKILESIEEKDIKTGVGRNLYEVEIPDPIKKDTPTGSNYLEEKGLMSAISVQEFMDVFRKKYPEKADQFEATIRSNAAPRHGEVEGWEMYRYLDDALGGQKQASKFLESLGYDGIHYFGGRDGEAYVIFNDEALQITKHHKY